MLRQQSCCQIVDIHSILQLYIAAHLYKFSEQGTLLIFMFVHVLARKAEKGWRFALMSLTNLCSVTRYQ